MFVTEHHLVINLSLGSMIREAAAVTPRLLSPVMPAHRHRALPYWITAITSLTTQILKALSNFLPGMASLQIIMCCFLGEDITKLHQNAVNPSHLQLNM